MQSSLIVGRYLELWYMAYPTHPAINGGVARAATLGVVGDRAPGTEASFGVGRGAATVAGGGYRWRRRRDEQGGQRHHRHEQQGRGQRQRRRKPGSVV